MGKKIAIIGGGNLGTGYCGRFIKKQILQTS